MEGQTGACLQGVAGLRDIGGANRWHVRARLACLLAASRTLVGGLAWRTLGVAFFLHHAPRPHKKLCRAWEKCVLPSSRLCGSFVMPFACVFALSFSLCCALPSSSSLPASFPLLALSLSPCFASTLEWCLVFILVDPCPPPHTLCFCLLFFRGCSLSKTSAAFFFVFFVFCLNTPLSLFSLSIRLLLTHPFASGPFFCLFVCAPRCQYADCFHKPGKQQTAAMVFGTRMEIQTSCDLTPVQADNYWRLRYRRDALRSQSWTEKRFVHRKRTSMRGTPRTTSEPASPSSRHVFFPDDDSDASSRKHSARASNHLPSLDTNSTGSSPKISSQASPSMLLSPPSSGAARPRLHRLRRRQSEPGSLADEHLRRRTLSNCRAMERLPSWDRALFAQLPAVPESCKPTTPPTRAPRRHSKVGDVEVKTDPVKRRVYSDRKPTRLPTLPSGTNGDPWRSKVTHRLSLS